MKVTVVSWILQRDIHSSEYTHTTTSKVDISFTLPLQDYFLMQHTDNVWGNVLINQNSSSLHRHIFRYWMLSTGHLHPTETNSCICLIIWQWKWDCDIEITAVMVLCTLLIQFYSLGPYTYIRFECPGTPFTTGINFHCSEEHMALVQKWGISRFT